MTSHGHAMTVADDGTLIDLITSARRRLVIIAPGLSASVAAAVAERWRALGPQAVTVTLDVDPEVCRLGLGEFGAVTRLSGTAAALHTTPPARSASRQPAWRRARIPLAAAGVFAPNSATTRAASRPAAPTSMPWVRPRSLAEQGLDARR